MRPASQTHRINYFLRLFFFNSFNKQETGNTFAEKQMHADPIDNTESDRDTALSWIARFRSGIATDEDRQEFALWLAQDSSHRQAMDSMLDMWADLAAVRSLYSSAPEITRRPAANQSNWLRAAIVSAACLVLVLIIWPQGSQDQNRMQYRTIVGEQRTIELEDSSIMTLNTDSIVTVSYNRERRSIELLRGEAFFIVASDSARPFEVETGSARVTAIGTAFNIYRDGQASSITVTEGVVRITELGGTGSRVPKSEVLHANQQLNATPRGLQPAISADVSHQLAWQRGELIARDMPLTELIRQIERYHDTHILIVDGNVAALTVSGIFELNELDPTLQALQLSLGLEIVELNSNTLQLLKPPQ